MPVFRPPSVKAENRPVTGFCGVGVHIHHERHKTPHGANLEHWRPFEPSAPIVHGLTCSRSPPRVTDHPPTGTARPRRQGDRETTKGDPPTWGESPKSPESPELPELGKSKVARESKVAFESRSRVEKSRELESRESAESGKLPMRVD